MPVYKPTELVKWDQNKQQMIAGYVQNSLDIWNINDAGEVSTIQIFLSDIYKKILANNIQLQDIPELNTKEILVGKTIRRLKKQETQDLPSFRRILASEVHEFNNRALENYIVLFPFYNESFNPPRINKFTVYGTTFQFKTWKYIKQNLHFDDFCQELNFHLAQYVDTFNLEGYFIPVLTSSTGRDVREAFEKASKAYDLLRVAFNLPAQFGRYNQQFGGYPRALGKILPPPVFGVFKSDGRYDSLLYTTNKYEYKNNSLSLEEIRSARRLSRLITVPRHGQEILAIVIDSFEKYQKALDLHEWGQVFLSLWQILESITLQNEQIDMRDVINRTTNLIASKAPYIKELLEALRKTRNELVHRGQFDEEKGLKEVGYLKAIVERAINSLLSRKDDLPTRAELSIFYESMPRGNADLKSRRKVMSYVLRKRK